MKIITTIKPDDIDYIKKWVEKNKYLIQNNKLNFPFNNFEIKNDIENNNILITNLSILNKNKYKIYNIKLIRKNNIILNFNINLIKLNEYIENKNIEIHNIDRKVYKDIFIWCSGRTLKLSGIKNILYNTITLLYYICTYLTWCNILENKKKIISYNNINTGHIPGHWRRCNNSINNKYVYIHPYVRKKYLKVS